MAVYLDDILVGGANSREHLHNLKALLQRLCDKGLKCNKRNATLLKIQSSILASSFQRMELKKENELML